MAHELNRWFYFEFSYRFSFIFIGISTTSLLLELSSYTVMALYNYTYAYSLLSYLEYPILLAQEYVLIALVLNYKRMLNQNCFVIIGAYWVFVLLFAYQICPRFLLAMTVVSTPNIARRITICYFHFISIL